MTPRTNTVRSLAAAGLLALVSSIARQPEARGATPAPHRRGTRPAETAEDIVAKSRAVYAALKSYADSGKIIVEYGAAVSPATDVHTFRTYFRSPRLFYFDFRQTPTAGRLVVWSDEQVFHSWWQATGNEDEYPKGKGINAFIQSGSPTRGSVAMIPAWLFPNAGLVGTLTELRDMTDAGLEPVDGRQCHKLTGVAKSVYRTGYETNVRKVAVWIDAETMLVRKVFEDSRAGAAMNVNRVTMTFTPHANPPLDDAHFKFSPPSAQQ